MQILESGMVFGDYKPEQVFKIEDSKLHHKTGAGVRSVEFILLKKTDKVFFVEAKSSSPKADSGMERYQEFLTEITEKFIHSFDMLNAYFLGRYDDGGQMGSDIKSITCANSSFIFVLVIRGHKDTWLLPLQEELNRKLRYHASIWKSRVIVMNDTIAREYNLVV